MSRLLHLVARPSQRFSQRLLMTEFAALKPRHLKRIVGRIIERDIAPADSVRSLIAEGALTKAALVDAIEYLALTDAATVGDAETLARWAEARIGVDRGGLLVQIGAVAGADAGDAHEKVEVALDVLLPNTAPPPVNPHSVQLLTMHGSKGLTRRVVVLPGLEEAWLPGTAAGADKEERERLFFVALSRATDFVLLTCPHNRVKGDPLNYETAGRGQPSSFLSRAGLTPSYHSG